MTRHTKPERTALEQRVAEQNRLIADIAASVNAGARRQDGKVMVILPQPGWSSPSFLADLLADYQTNVTTEADDEDAILDEGEPREIPLTEAQKRTEDWMERATEDEAWREEEDGDV